ncbi:energy transducer TonB [Burkholderia territorii]|uniref:energy transducer TonB n=1 Tax=Burkholderia territorii TaxID=1503055 RepID=UPI000B134545|nr:energy transducer TonB [Burkholderia territorii]
MGLLDRLLDQAVGANAVPRKAIFRVLLDDEGRVRDVVLKRSSGNRDVDGRGIAKFFNMKFPPGRLAGSTKKARRWHEFAYSDDT